MPDFHYKPDGAVLKAFMKSNDFWRGLRGPVGSGKSVGSAVELWRRALQQEPDSRGIRRTRWAIIRNTGPQLKTTTIKTWLDWFPEDTYGPFRWGVPYTHHIRVADVDMENIFLALDSEDDIRKLLSLELTGVWANEAREMPKAIIDACTMRVGRYPSMRDGGPSWYGMIADTNAPEDDHWWAVMSGDAPLPEFISDEEALMLRKPEGWKFFTQPPAMLELKNNEGEVIGYENNPEAENAKNLTPEYYNKIITGKQKDWIDVYVLNRLGSVTEGKPVYPNWRDEAHKATEHVGVMPTRTLWVGLDFGFTPAMAVGQRSAHGQWHILKEVCPDDVSTQQFAGIIKSTLAELMANNDQVVKIYGDPSGSIRSSSREDKKSVFQILRAHGVNAYGAPSNDIAVRIDTVKGIIDRMVDGQPGLVVNPECTTLIKGFRNGYHYRRIGGLGSNRHEVTPYKDKYSHPHDALQYMFLGAGEGRKIMQAKNQGGTKAKAKVGWNVFQKKRRRNKRRMSI
jgi:hypothetical protein